MITIHPSNSARSTVEDPSVLDFDMLQTGHSDRASIPNTVESVQKSYGASPRMPVLVGEVCYEGIMEASQSGGAAVHVLGFHVEWLGGTYVRLTASGRSTPRSSPSGRRRTAGHGATRRGRKPIACQARPSWAWRNSS